MNSYLTPKTITFNAAKHDPSVAILWITSNADDGRPEMVSPIYALRRQDLTCLIEGAERWLRQMDAATPAPSARVAKARQADVEIDNDIPKGRPMRKGTPPPPPVTPRHADGRLKAKPKAPAPAPKAAAPARKRR